MSPCTVVLGLKVESGCKISKIKTKIPDVAMGKILQSDILDACVGGIAYINVTFSDKVREVFFVCFSPVLCFDFLMRVALGGRGRGVALCVLWLLEVVVDVAMVCQGIKIKTTILQVM